MDTSDRRDSNLPARLPSVSSHLPAHSTGSYGGGSGRDLAVASSAMQISPQSILRGLARNWWRILLLWLGLSLPLAYLIYSRVQPTYTAYSVLLAEPTQPDLFGGSGGAGGVQEIERYIQTQIQSILSDRVLNAALADQTVRNLPFVKESDAPLMDLKQKLVVTNKANTYHIQVAFESTSPQEAAAIVNSVVSAYMESLRIYKLGSDEVLKKRMQAWLDKVMQEKNAKEKLLFQLMDDGLVDPQNLTANDRNNSAKGQDVGEAAKALTTKDVSIEQYRKYCDQLVQTDLELIPLESLLQQRTAESQDQDQSAEDLASDLPPVQAGMSDEQLQMMVEVEFKRDPTVAQLIQDLQTTGEELTHSAGVARKGYDPAVVAANKRMSQLKARYNALWKERYPEIRDRLSAVDFSSPKSGGEASPRDLSMEELRGKVDMLRRQKEALVQVLNSMEVETKQSNSDTFRASRLNADIEILSHRYEPVHKNLEDLKFRTDKDTVRIELQDRAEVPKLPSSNKRNRFLAAAPLVILCMVLGLFALLEVKAERVGDPDMLSTRVQSEVYSLPPLPTVRSARKLGSPGDDDQIDRFIQRLDHLRFAVCGDHPEVGLGRCVLITSAIGGEGKTTLAAQLAARCGHSGHSTLLIDADLRRGSLSTLLDIPEGLGLSDVLKEEANVEDVLIPVQGGTFHLLCAGSPIQDTSRVFQGRGFGMLIARLRQLYDLIIIDSPPVLPVPDGLIIGRWTDGAVLASRYDVSRAPQVERARRQLNNAGIAVLGTVINGMRASDSYYGRYTYSRGRSNPREAAAEAEADVSPTS